MNASIAASGFYRIVPLHPPLMVGGLALVGLWASLTLAFDSASGSRVLVPLVFLQMFAASTGFAVPARRGHYDLLFTGGPTRLRIAAIHLVVSIAPGVIVWQLVAFAECALVGNARDASTLAAGSVAAMMTASCFAWAITVPLPRLSGGIIWLLAIVLLLVTTDAWREAADATGPSATASASLTLWYALCPFVLLGRRFDSSELWLLLPGLALSLLAVVAALLWAIRFDVCLEASQ